MGVTSFHSAVARVNRERRCIRAGTGTGVLSPCSQISTFPRSPSRATFLASNSDKTPCRGPMATETVLRSLEQAALHAPGKGLLIYHASPTEDSPIFLSYEKLRSMADERALHLLPHFSSKQNPVILLHVDSHLDGIVWFWSILAAGGVPCISSPLPKDLLQRKIHLEHLQKVLNNPFILTTDALLAEFAGLENVQIKTIDQIERSAMTQKNSDTGSLDGYRNGPDDLAVLMLTSGSTGNSKAVDLTHKQLLRSVQGKSQLHKTTSDDIFLNWTGLDHVANLTEIHLHSLSLMATQIHIPSSLVLADPLLFLKKIIQHKVSYAFAPNFFLASLVQRLSSVDHSLLWKETKISHALASTPTETLANLDLNGERLQDKSIDDLSSLRALISGGESNLVSTCVALTNLLTQYGAPKSFIRPGFGMTETCAGSIYNSVDCPEYDLSRNSQFACLGECIPSISFRICQQNGSVAPDNGDGELQVKGEAIFERYYNDVESMEKSFTEDGWFKTGDRGYKDSNGRLHLTGRDKETVVINGVNYHPQAIESAIEAAKIPGVTPSFTVVFAHRPKASETESVVIVYLPSYDISDPDARVFAAGSISKVVVTYCGARPYKVLPLDENFLQKSSLGKLARSKIRKAFEDGVYGDLIKADRNFVACFMDKAFEPATTVIEFEIIFVCSNILNTTGALIGINDDLFKLGISSIDLLKLRLHLQTELKIPEIPITIFFSHPQIRNLALALADLKSNQSSYDPIVTLQPHGSKTPLFLIHPGIGEILVFMNLSRHLTDRPVYAIRARGFDGEPYFSSFLELVTTYHSAIKRIQPHGPYALLGYSFGSIAAFEITKIMEAAGDEVKMLAILDQAPFFKERARGYDWYEVAMTISFFLSLVTEEFAYAAIPAMRLLSHSQVLDIIFALAPKSRLDELGMTREKLDNWANIALQLKKIVWDYEPKGVVSKMDVFYTGPLVGLVKAKTTEEWFRDFISKWGAFVDKDGVGWYEVGGTHRSMISPPHLDGFVRTFKRVLEERGL